MRKSIMRGLETLTGKKLSPDLWAFLIEEGYIDEVVNGKLTIDELFKKLPKIPDNKLTVNKAVELHETTGLRLQILSEVAVIEALENPFVIEFRETVLDNQLISEEVIDDWIELQAENDGEPTAWFPDAPFDRQVYKRDPDTGEFYTEHLQMPVRKGFSEPQFQFRALTYYSSNSGEEKSVLTTADGVLESLRVICENLTIWFSWREAEATNFILTGKMPHIDAAAATLQLKSYFPAASRIELSIDPTLTPQEVVEYYKLARDEMFHGKRYRSLGKKHLHLAEFHLMHKDNDEPWVERRDAWNKNFPDWPYKKNQLSNFQRDCTSALDRLRMPMGETGTPGRPAFGEPEWEGEENE